MVVNLDENGVFLNTKLMTSSGNISLRCEFTAVAETEFFERDSERVYLVLQVQRLASGLNEPTIAEDNIS